MPGVPPPAGSWWRQPCPARGASLTHAHWAQCRPDGVHPADDTGNEGNNHPINMCCHCQLTEQIERLSNEAGQPPLDVAARLRHMGLIPDTEHTDSTPVEPRAIDPTRTRQRPDADYDLDAATMFKLAVNVIELERRRGYR